MPDILVILLIDWLIDLNVFFKLYLLVYAHFSYFHITFAVV